MASSICVGTTFSENGNGKVCFWYLTKGRGKAGEPWTFPLVVLHPTESSKHTICTGTILWWRAVWIALLSFRVQWVPFAAKGVGKTRTSTFWQNHQFTSHLCGGTFCRKWDARHMTTLTPPQYCAPVRIQRASTKNPTRISKCGCIHFETAKRKQGGCFSS